MTHDWLYLDVWQQRQVVRCRRCGKHASYLLSGYKPEPPRSECEPPEPQWIIPISLRGYA